MDPSGLNYWEYLMEKINTTLLQGTITLQAGERSTIYDMSGKGFWFAGLLVSNSKKAGVEYNLDGAVKLNTIESIYDLGLTFPNGMFFFVSKYDETNSEFAMAWGPSYPLFFKNNAKITLVNTGSSAIQVTYVMYLANVTGEERG